LSVCVCRVIYGCVSRSIFIYYIFVSRWPDGLYREYIVYSQIFTNIQDAENSKNMVFLTKKERFNAADSAGCHLSDTLTGYHHSGASVPKWNDLIEWFQNGTVHRADVHRSPAAAAHSTPGRRSSPPRSAQPQPTTRSAAGRQQPGRELQPAAVDRREICADQVQLAAGRPPKPII